MSGVSRVNSTPALGLWHGGGVGGVVGTAHPLSARPWPRVPRVAGTLHSCVACAITGAGAGEQGWPRAGGQREAAAKIGKG